MPVRVRDKARQRGATFIRAWRKHRNMAQVQLAKSIGAAPATVSRIETGELPYTQDNLEAIAEALRTTPVALLARKPGQDDEDLWSRWYRAKPAHRRQITHVVRAMLDRPQGEA